MNPAILSILANLRSLGATTSADLIETEFTRLEAELELRLTLNESQTLRDAVLNAQENLSNIQAQIAGLSGLQDENNALRSDLASVTQQRDNALAELSRLNDAIDAAQGQAAPV